MSLRRTRAGGMAGAVACIGSVLKASLTASLAAGLGASLTASAQAPAFPNANFERPGIGRQWTSSFGALDENVRKEIHARIKKTAEGIAQSAGATAEVQISETETPLHRLACTFLRSICRIASKTLKPPTS